MSDTEILLTTIAKLRGEVAHLHEAAARRNKQLDAFGIVWCDGGCPGGMHRCTPDRMVTAQHVADLIVNAGRAIRWYVNNKGRSQLEGPSDTWEAARAEIIAATPKTFRKMINHAETVDPTPRLELTSAERVTATDDVLIIDDRLGDPRLWRRDPAGDTPLGMLCFADMSGERTSLRPGETCHRLVTSDRGSNV